MRVPGIVISPYAKRGFIDHQTLSFDAYNKFIEDDFLGGQRLDPSTDGRPDPRPDVRESNALLGHLSLDFNFNQTPRTPELLPTCPKTDLKPAPQISGATSIAADISGTWTATATNPCGTISSYAWSWGDGTTTSTTTGSAPHTYATAGSYTITLTVTDDFAWPARSRTQCRSASTAKGGFAALPHAQRVHMGGARGYSAL
jgi:hypothetical protein